MTATELLASSAIDKTLILFEKEKGGVGSTGTLVTIAHLLSTSGAPVEFIEASMTQLDVYNAYHHHHKVHKVDLAKDDASSKIIDIVDQAPHGAYILANIPGGRFEEIDGIHSVIRIGLEEDLLKARVEVVWTMGLDAASSATLLALLGGDLPGPVHINLPAWAGREDDFILVNDDLREQIAETGGSVFATPQMPSELYDRFRRDQIAVDKIPDGATLGVRVALKAWERTVRERLEGYF